MWTNMVVDMNITNYTLPGFSTNDTPVMMLVCIEEVFA